VRRPRKQVAAAVAFVSSTQKLAVAFEKKLQWLFSVQKGSPLAPQQAGVAAAMAPQQVAVAAAMAPQQDAAALASEP